MVHTRATVRGRGTVCRIITLIARISTSATRPIAPSMEAATIATTPSELAQTRLAILLASVRPVTMVQAMGKDRVLK